MANKAIKCFLALRDVPPETYRLATDGKKWKHDCAQRHRLVWILAGAANPDGTNITLGVDRMAKGMGLGISRRTVFRVLADLRILEHGSVPFLTEGKLAGFNSTARRALNVAAIRAAAGLPVVPDTVVPDTQNTVVPDTPKTAAQSCQIAQPVVPDTPSLPSETRLSGTLPGVAFTENPTATTNRQSAAPENGAVDRAGEEASAKIAQWIKASFQFMGAETNKSRAGLASLVAKHGPGVVLKALISFDRRPGGFDGVKNAWSLFLAEAESLIDNLPNPKLEAEKQARQEAFILEQIRDENKRNQEANERYRKQRESRGECEGDFSIFETP